MVIVLVFYRYFFSNTLPFISCGAGPMENF
jgi:hypothetical protein